MTFALDVPSLVGTLKAASLDQAKRAVVVGKASLITALRDVLNPSDLLSVENYFDLALGAKIGAFTATTAHVAQEFTDQFEGALDAVEELIKRYEIVASAALARLARSLMHQVIAGAFAVGGAVLQAALAALIPAGGLVGAGLNAGIQHVVAYFLGD